MIDIKAAVSGNKTVTFSHYHDGALWYKTEFGDVFPAPIDDIGNATFNATEKAILLMRYMRKWNQTDAAKLDVI